MQVLRIAAKVLPFIGKRLMKGQDKIFEQIRIVNFHGLIAGLLTGLGLLLVYILMAFMVVYDLNGGVCAIAFIGLTTGMFCFAACTISLVTLYVSDNGKKKGV